MSYNSELQANNADLLSILNAVNALPDASEDVELPELTNEGTAADLMSGKELIDGNGEIVVGTYVPPEHVLQEKSVTPTKNVQEVTPDSNYDGLSKVNVGAIPAEYIIPSGTKDITENGDFNVTEYESVSVAVPIPDGYIQPSGSLNITENGEYDVTEKAGVLVDVEPTLQSKSVSPTTSAQEVIPDAGYDGLNKVTVNAVPTETKTATPTTSEQKITPSNGKFLSQVTVNAMPTATQATPSISVNSSGLITASATQSAGYVEEGIESATKQLPTQAAKTVTPTKSEQTAVESGVFTTGAIKVGAIPSSYIQPTGTKSITENGTYSVTEFANVEVNVPTTGGGGDEPIEWCTGSVYTSGESIIGRIEQWPTGETGAIGATVENELYLLTPKNAILHFLLAWPSPIELSNIESQGVEIINLVKLPALFPVEKQNFQIYILTFKVLENDFWVYASI